MSRLDLTDTTFMIPVKIDSEDRILNLNIVTMYLRTYFDTNIIIAEQGAHSRIPDLIGQTLYNTYIFCKDPTEGFHKSLLINSMIKQSTTPIVVMHDSDVLCYVDQYVEAVNLLRQNKVDFVYPFNGHVSNIKKNFIPQILDTMRIDFLQQKTSNTKDLAPGGCVMYNRSKFIQAGMMNEHFVSYGPEDAEQLLRQMRLGYKFTRTSRILFHLDHVKTNHSTDNHRFRNQNWAEYNRIKNMNPANLRQYIATWSWTK